MMTSKAGTSHDEVDFPVAINPSYHQLTKQQVPVAFNPSYQQVTKPIPISLNPSYRQSIEQQDIPVSANSSYQQLTEPLPISLNPSYQQVTEQLDPPSIIPNPSYQQVTEQLPIILNPSYQQLQGSTERCTSTHQQPVLESADDEHRISDYELLSSSNMSLTKQAQYDESLSKNSRLSVPNYYVTINHDEIKHSLADERNIVKSSEISCTAHVRVKKKTTSCFNEDISYWEYILAVLSIITVMLSVVVISLSLIIATNTSNSPGNTIDGVTTNKTSAATEVSEPSTCNCHKYTFTSSPNFTVVTESISMIGQEISELRQSKNVSVRNKLQQFYTYMNQITVIDDFLQRLIPQSNQPKQPTLSGLNLTSSISINHGDCTQYHTSCSFPVNEVFDVQACQSPAFYFANESHIIVSVSGSVTPSNNIATQSLTNATTVSYQFKARDGQSISNDITLDQLKRSDIFVICFSFNVAPTDCDFYITRCSYQKNNVTSFLSINN